jgi:hypothetical protein
MASGKTTPTKLTLFLVFGILLTDLEKRKRLSKSRLKLQAPAANTFSLNTWVQKANLITLALSSSGQLFIRKREEINWIPGSSKDKIIWQ